jgi:glycosyltransferase involved in cell wall biosynthesis
MTRATHIVPPAITRLALFTDTWRPQVNGVARTLDRLVSECHRRGIATMVVTPDDGSADDGSADDGAADPPDAQHLTVRWPARPFWAYPHLHMATPSTARARALLQDFRPDLVHVATPFGVGLSGRQAARALDLPLVSSYHTHFTAYLRHYRLQHLDAVAWPFLRWFHNGGRATFAPTQHVADQLRAQGFRGAAVWSRGIDTVRFHPARRSLERRRALGVPDDALLCCYVGRLAPEKGIDVAIEAMRPLLAAYPNRLRLLLVGDGPAEARLRAAAPAGVLFAGRQEGSALAECYASSDVFVFPSATETFGNVVLEAMASGLCVISHHEGPTYEFAHDCTAYPVDVTSPDALRAAVHTLMHDAPRRAALAAAGLREAQRRDWPSVWDNLFGYYSHVVNHAHAPVGAPVSGLRTIAGLSASSGQ